MDPTAGYYTYYERKHNPHISLNSITDDPKRSLRTRNFNDFAVDVNASAIPQHLWITPNLVNDSHDTDVTFVSAWLENWLLPLLSNLNFNDNRTLIQLTFDENESYSSPNVLYTVLLGGAVPFNLRGTNDTTFYTHYSMLSSIENNWGLGSLGRQDTNRTLAAVWAFQASLTGYRNYKPSASEIPMLNLTGIIPGACNPTMWTPILAPNTTAVGAGNGPVLYNSSSTDIKLTGYSPINLTALNAVNPVSVNPNYSTAGQSIVNASGAPSSAQTASPSSTSQSCDYKLSVGLWAVSFAVLLGVTSPLQHVLDGLMGSYQPFIHTRQAVNFKWNT